MMKLCELYTIESETKAGGHTYLLGRVAPGSDLKRFLLLPDPTLPRHLWLVIDKSKNPPRDRKSPTGNYYLAYLHQLLDPARQD